MSQIVKTTIPYSNTKSFSNLVLDYVDEKESLKPFIHAFPSEHEILNQIKRKQNQVVDRTLLVEVLNFQYTNCILNEFVKQNLDLLQQESTYTVCTAHQPNIFTGFLYFIYKIVHAINLAKKCKLLFPAFNFVPVYYIGSEDNDLEEIGTFHYNSKTYSWESKQTGACGRMTTESLREILIEIKKTFNENLVDEKELIQLLESAYNGQHTLAEATRMIVNDLFGQYGLIVIDGDHPAFKKSYSNVMLDELIKRNSQSIVLDTVSKLNSDYKLQANPREINLFYLTSDIRERIEFSNGKFYVLNTDISFSESEIKDELNEYPERFSPNVILRPIYQETLLPNIVFIGGGGELAYWLELKSLFEYHHVVFPLIILRNSVLWIEDKTAAKMKKMGLSIDSFFNEQHQIFHQLAVSNLKLEPFNLIQTELSTVYDHLRQMGQEISPNLSKSMEAHIAKLQRVEKRIEQKVVSNLKKNEIDTLDQIENIKNKLFPNGHLQERYLNFLSIYKEVGKAMFNILIENQEPFGKEFLILTYSSKYSHP